MKILFLHGWHSTPGGLKPTYLQDHGHTVLNPPWGGRMMDQKAVNKLKRELEEAIANVMVGMGLKKLPLLPSQHTMHLMAKAAVAVYEAAVENQHRSAAD